MSDEKDCGRGPWRLKPLRPSSWWIQWGTRRWTRRRLSSHKSPRNRRRLAPTVNKGWKIEEKAPLISLSIRMIFSHICDVFDDLWHPWRLVFCLHCYLWENEFNCCPKGEYTYFFFTLDVYNGKSNDSGRPRERRGSFTNDRVSEEQDVSMLSSLSKSLFLWLGQLW